MTTSLQTLTYSPVTIILIFSSTCAVKKRSSYNLGITNVIFGTDIHDADARVIWKGPILATVNILYTLSMKDHILI